MPVKNTILKEKTLAAHKQLSYENLVTAWLMSDVFTRTRLIFLKHLGKYRICIKHVKYDRYFTNINTNNRICGVKF